MKDKLKIIGDAMVRNTGQNIASSLKNFESCVYSTSGLSVKQATRQIPKILHDCRHSDTVLLNVGM